MGPKMITHIFIIWEFNFLIAQDICYTGLPGRNSFVQFDAFMRYFL